jgi:3-oxoacyl-(acyl-carrier-protein) synthase
VIAAWAVRTATEKPRDGRESRYLDRLAMHALDAGVEAAERAGAKAGPATGIFMGTFGLEPRWDEMAAALRDQHDDCASSWARGLCRLHPFFVLRHLSNAPQALLAARLFATGDSACFGGPTAGAHALASAARALTSGTIEHAVVVAFGGASAAAVVLAREGVANVQVATAVDPLSTRDPRREFVEATARKLARGARVAEAQSDGAATALLQAIAWCERLAPGEAVVAPSFGDSGLVAAVRVEVP